VDESARPFTHPLYDTMLSVPGLDVAVGKLDELLTWGAMNSIWIFPMATSCCGIEFMAAAASRVDLDRMGAIVRGTPRQCDVMIVAGTITVKMAPRVKRLWDQMPEPKWCIAMGSCAISGDFYRDIYSVIPGIDTAIPVDVYVPGCSRRFGSRARANPSRRTNDPRPPIGRSHQKLAGSRNASRATREIRYRSPSWSRPWCSK
jgi:NADH-quinone oxidoreductase subunit B